MKGRRYGIDFVKEVLVSIHAPVKGRLLAAIFFAVFDGFNPRPREGATVYDNGDVSYTSFNPRPREGATCNVGETDVVHGVSIHAPVKGRRGRKMRSSMSMKFQSTPP